MAAFLPQIPGRLSKSEYKEVSDVSAKAFSLSNVGDIGLHDIF